MKVLFLTPQLPWPLDQGARIRNYHLGWAEIGWDRDMHLRGVRETWNLVPPSHPMERIQSEDRLRRHGLEGPIAYVPVQTPASSYTKCVATYSSLGPSKTPPDSGA